MKCPYCSEEINDNAVVCRYCGRDLWFFRPLEARLQLAERNIKELETALSELAAKREAPKLDRDHGISRSQTGLRKISLWLTSIVVILPFFCRYLLVWLFPDFTIDAYILFSIFYLPFGLIIGIKWRGSHLGTYFFTGLAAGFMQMMVFIYQGLIYPELRFPVIMTIALSFTSGALFGDLIERKLYPDRRSEGFAKRFAEKIITSSKTSDVGGSKVHYDERVKRIASLIAALAPILALIGTIISALLAFLAKKP